MSTSALVIVQGATRYEPVFETIRLGRSMDGYPTNVLGETLSTVLEVNKLKKNKKAVLLADTFYGKLIGVATCEHGSGYEVKDRTPTRLKLDPNDTGWGWAYVINCDSKTIEIYSGHYNEYKDPYDWVKCVYQQHQEETRNQITDQITALRELGWIVNPMSNAEKFISKI
jgi:hypothetical protein